MTPALPKSRLRRFRPCFLCVQEHPNFAGWAGAACPHQQNLIYPFAKVEYSLYVLCAFVVENMVLDEDCQVVQMTGYAESAQYG